jgi:hypothetical protein
MIVSIEFDLFNGKLFRNGKNLHVIIFTFSVSAARGKNVLHEINL